MPLETRKQLAELSSQLSVGARLLHYHGLEFAPPLLCPSTTPPHHTGSSLCCRHIALLLGSLLPGAKPVQLTYGGSTAVGVSIHKCEFTPKHDTRSHEVGSSDTKNSLGASIVKVDEKTLLAQFWPIAYKPIATSWNQNTSFSCWIRI
jgi:hypothetical protein